MSQGYIYCFGNSSMPNIYKIGMTERTPNERLSEANSSDTWRPPTPYSIIFAKRVLNPLHKESIIHNILKNSRINQKREFFRESLDTIKLLFDLVDGEYYPNNISTTSTNNQPVESLSQPHDSNTMATTMDNYENIQDQDQDQDHYNIIISNQPETLNTNEDISDNSESGENPRIIRGCRVMAQCFNHNQRIRHRIRKDKHDESNWVGIYNANEDGILFDGQVLTLNQFALRHYASELIKRSKVNAWLECECEVNQIWVSTYDLPLLR